MDCQLKNHRLNRFKPDLEPVSVLLSWNYIKKEACFCLKVTFLYAWAYFHFKASQPAYLAVTAQLRFDAQELIVFRHTVRAGGCAGFDLTGVQRNCEVRDGGVFRLARAVRGDGAPSRTVTEIHGFNGLGQRTDLVDLHQQRIRRIFLDRFADAFGVGHKQIIADDLALVTDGFGPSTSTIPVILRETVFDGNDGIVLDPLRPEFNHLFAGEFFAFLAEVVLLGLLVIQFGGGGSSAMATCSPRPALKPAFSMEARISSRASLFALSAGA
jgi:hypothetical protein